MCVVAALLLSTACGPPSAVVIAPGAQPMLARVESVFVDAAVVRASGAGGPRSLRDEIEADLARRVRPIAALRDAADVILVFDTADHLDGSTCVDPVARWHWWGFVLTREGRELASLHGELPPNRGPTTRPFVKGVRTLLAR